MIHSEVEGKLRSFGLTGCYQGYRCLVYAALLVHADPGALEMPSKLIYPEVARLCRIDIGSVDQAIRTAMQVCYRRSAPAVHAMCGTSALPSIQQFVAGLAACCCGGS